jgi:hypothetical protein
MVKSIKYFLKEPWGAINLGTPPDVPVYTGTGQNAILISTIEISHMKEVGYDSKREASEDCRSQ